MARPSSAGPSGQLDRHHHQAGDVEDPEKKHDGGDKRRPETANKFGSPVNEDVRRRGRDGAGDGCPATVIQWRVERMMGQKLGEPLEKLYRNVSPERRKGLSS